MTWKLCEPAARFFDAVPSTTGRASAPSHEQCWQRPARRSPNQPALPPGLTVAPSAGPERSGDGAVVDHEVVGDLRSVADTLSVAHTVKIHSPWRDPVRQTVRSVRRALDVVALRDDRAPGVLDVGGSGTERRLGGIGVIATSGAFR